MSTIDNKSLIVDLLSNNGRYSDDPQCTSIWSYINSEGRETNSVFWSAANDMRESPWVNYPKLLWTAKDGLTKAGQDWLDRNGGNTK